jgi:copper chaperone CopZ
MTIYTLIVKGMTCGGCERAISSALRKVEGVSEVKADHLAGRVVVEGVGVELDSLRAAVEDAGYDCVGVA